MNQSYDGTKKKHFRANNCTSQISDSTYCMLRVAVPCKVYLKNLHYSINCMAVLRFRTSLVSYVREKQHRGNLLNVVELKNKKEESATAWSHLVWSVAITPTTEEQIQSPGKYAKG